MSFNLTDPFPAPSVQWKFGKDQQLSFSRRRRNFEWYDPAEQFHMQCGGSFHTSIDACLQQVRHAGLETLPRTGSQWRLTRTPRPGREMYLPQFQRLVAIQRYDSSEVQTIPKRENVRDDAECGGKRRTKRGTLRYRYKVYCSLRISG
jgi:hypothetical protein